MERSLLSKHSGLAARPASGSPCQDAERITDWVGFFVGEIFDDRLVDLIAFGLLRALSQLIVVVKDRILAVPRRGHASFALTVPIGTC